MCTSNSLDSVSLRMLLDAFYVIFIIEFIIGLMISSGGR